jgi:predicted SAM-dependent methyltransferase
MNDLKLDLGCGTTKKDGFYGVDLNNFIGVDVIHDLNQFPYPFEDNSVNEIWMDNVLEHLDKPLLVMSEIFRICKNNSRVTISVPYFRSLYAAIDPTHVNFFSVSYFNYFDPAHPFFQKYQYSKARFSVKNIEFDREWKAKMGFFHTRLVRYAEKHPWKYEEKLSHLLPLNSLTFHLETIK